MIHFTNFSEKLLIDVKVKNNIYVYGLAEITPA